MARAPLCPSPWRWPMIWHAVLKCMVRTIYWLCQRSNLRWEFARHNLFFSRCQHRLCVLPHLYVHSCLPCLKWAVSQSWSWQQLTALVCAVWAWLGLALGPMNSWRAAWWCWPIRVSYMSSLCPPSKCWSTILAYEEKTSVESHLVFSPNMAKVGNANSYMRTVHLLTYLKAWIYSETVCLVIF